MMLSVPSVLQQTGGRTALRSTGGAGGKEKQEQGNEKQVQLKNEKKTYKDL